MFIATVYESSRKASQKKTHRRITLNERYLYYKLKVTSFRLMEADSTFVKLTVIAIVTFTELSKYLNTDNTICVIRYSGFRSFE